MTKIFKALVVRKTKPSGYSRAIEERNIDDLPKGEVLIRVHYSSLNYKDGLSCIGNPGVTRRYPHTPGIDAAGTVADSSVESIKEGDKVVIVSQDLGMNTSGGFGQYIRVPASWVMPLPLGLSLRQSMIYGTAGYTAALAIDTLQRSGVQPQNGPLIVTGSTGGLGSIAVAILAHLGYEVHSATGKPNSRTFLEKLGSTEIYSREQLDDRSGRPFLKETWAGGIDTVGGHTLATILRSLKTGGQVAATGMVASTDLPTSVLPFIIRGVNLLGINAQGTSMAKRQEIWSKMASEWKFPMLEQLAVDRSLVQLDTEINLILDGGQIGRVVVDLE